MISLNNPPANFPTMDGASMLEAALGQAPIGIALVDKDLRLVWANDFLARFSRIPAGEHAGRSMRELLPALAKKLHSVYHGILENGKPVTGVEVMDGSLSLPGGERCCMADFYLVRAGHNGASGIGILVREVTGQSTAEECRLRLDWILENSNDAIIGVAITGPGQSEITAWNAAAERMFGYGADEIQGRPVSFLVPAERADDIPRIREILERGERVDNFATVRVRKDGTRVDVLLSVSPIQDAAGRLVGASTIARDVTRQIQAHEQEEKMATRLSDDRARFEAILRQLPVGVVIVDAVSGEIILINKRMEQIWRRCFPSFAELKDVRHGFHPDGSPYQPEEWPLVRCLNGQGSVVGEEIEIVHDDGRRSTVRVSADAVRDGNDRLIAVVGVYDDYTERRNLEEQFRQAQKMEAVGRLAGGVAHDFNNLLTVIIGYAQMMFEGTRSPSSVREDLQTILDSANRAADLTQQLLTFSRRQVVQPKILDLNATLGGIEKMLRRLIGENIMLETRLAPGIGNVKADPGQINQILMNLVLNARDALPDGGKITIETGSIDLTEEYARTHSGVLPGRYTMLAVSDNGRGMDVETRRRIFEPFFTTKELGKGTGLGLSTVYGVVKQCGGDIWIYSEPDKGTTFKIYLPTEQQIELLAAQPRAHQAFTGSETILLVEDDPLLRGMVRSMLKRLGYSVVEAGGVYEAVELNEQINPDLLITDVIMPHMSGRALAGRLASVRPELKILYMSGYTDDVVLRHGVLDPGVHFLQKPFDSQTLARKVREVLDSPGVAGPSE